MESRDCDRCGLRQGVRRIVWGEGPTPCDVMIVGEGPGKVENRKGRPFWGPSGIRLQVLLGLAGLSRDEVYITNVVRCRPPKDRTPRKAEIAACRLHMLREWGVAQPHLIIALGDTAAKWFDPTIRLAKDHGIPRPLTQADITDTITLVPMYHPAYSLYRNISNWPVQVADWRLLNSRLAVGKPGDPLYTPGFILGSPAGFDVETASPEGPCWVQSAHIVGFSTSVQPGLAKYSQCAPTVVEEWLEDSTQVKACHNTKFEITQLRKYGIELRGFEDTKLAAYLLDYPSTHLKHLTQQLLGVTPITYEEVTQGRSMDTIPVEEVLPYAAADADHTLRLWHVLSPELDRLGLRDLYERVEKPLIPILAAMEAHGVRVDQDRVQKAVAHFDGLARAAELRAHVVGRVPGETNLGSHDQLGSLLAERDAPCKERTEIKGLPKTDQANLIWLRDQGWEPEFMGHLLDFKEKRKLRAFPEGFLAQSTWDGAIHPSFNQCGHMEEELEESGSSPITGRLSCSGPNLQQVPHHGRGKGKEYEGYGQLIRRCLTARPGHLLIAADIGQQEPRITAIVGPEPAMLRDFRDGVLPYSVIGEAIYGRPVAKSDAVEWHTAKTFFLALTYGAEWDKLCDVDPRLSKVQAMAGYKNTVTRYPGLRAFGDRVRLELHEHGYVRDYFGRIRWLPGVYSNTRAIREASYRAAINMYIQGPAATMTKLAMQRVHDELPPGAHMVLQIHDEVVCEVEVALVPQVAEILLHMADDIMPIYFPVDIKVGPDLGTMEYHAAV